MASDVKPVRIQRSRAKGARLTSPNGLPVVCVSRPSVFGNPFTVATLRELGYIGTDEEFRKACAGAFREWLTDDFRRVWDGDESRRRRDEILKRLPSLRGKNLACWCPLGDSCHADVLLEIANSEEPAHV